MILETAILKKAYKIIDQVVPGPGLLSSQFARISASAKSLTINLSGLVFAEISLPFTDHDSASWSFYADRRVLGGFINSATTEKIELILAKDQVTMKSGRQKILLVPMGDISGYQQWKRSPKAKVVELPESIHRDLVLLAKYSPDLAALDHLSAVQIIKGYGMIATDSMILCAKTDPKVDCNIALPSGIAKLVPTLDCKQMVIEPSGVGLILEHGYLYQTNSQKLLNEYPLETVKDLISGGMKAEAVMKISGSEFSNALQYLDNFAGFGAGSGASISATTNKKVLTLSLKLPSGVIEKRIPLLNEPSQMSESWQIEPLVPWVKHIADVLKDSQVIHAKSDRFQYFRTKSFILAMVATA